MAQAKKILHKTLSREEMSRPAATPVPQRRFLQVAVTGTRKPDLKLLKCLNTHREQIFLAQNVAEMQVLLALMGVQNLTLT